MLTVYPTLPKRWTPPAPTSSSALLCSRQRPAPQSASFLPLQPLADVTLETIHPSQNHCRDERILVWEVVEQPTLAHVRLAGHGVEGQPRHAITRHHPLGSLQQPRPCITPFSSHIITIPSGRYICQGFAVCLGCWAWERPLPKKKHVTLKNHILTGIPPENLAMQYGWAKVSRRA